MKYKLFKLILIFIISLFYSNFSLAGKLFISSPELAHLEKIKKIKNIKKQKPRKDGITYVGQKKLILENGYGIMRFVDGGLFVGYFHNSNLRDGAWIIKGDVSYETYEYIEKNKPKKDSNGIPLVKKTTFRKAKDFEIDYIKENVFLKNKITYEKYLELTGKDKLIAKKEKSKSKNENKAKVINKDEKYYKYSKTGFNIFTGNLNDDENKPYIVKGYYENDCLKHGLVRYLDKKTNQSKQDVFGVFENCAVFDPSSKFANLIFNKDGKLQEIIYHKKDVSHLYGVRVMLGVEIQDLPNNSGVQIVNFQKDLPAIESDLKEKDLILNINGIPVENNRRFIQLIKESEPNKKIIIDYVPNNKINSSYEFSNSDIKNTKITPKLVKSKIDLRLAYLPKKKEYVEFIYDHKSNLSSVVHDYVELEKNSKEWEDRQKLLRKDFKRLKEYYDAIKETRSDKTPLFDFTQLYVLSNKSRSSLIVKKTQDEFKPEDLDDKDPPTIKIASNFTFNNSSYSIKGEVQDNKSDIIYIEVDGILSNTKNGKFVVDRFSPVDEQIEIVAIDKWGNRSKPSLINIKINKQKKIIAKKLDRLDPSTTKNDLNENRVALIIGIENYSNTPKASYANLDAEFFYEYAKNIFGVKDENIKLMINEEANLIDTLSALNKWLPGKIKENKTELIVYFAGHGLASTDGKELYFLPQDGDSDLLARTGISRTELFESITKHSPKNTIIFLDTCYSGVSRDEKTLLASARPVRIVADDQEGIPDNFTIFTASKLDQISSGLEEAKHGIFSYYLMKGLEGNADINQDKKITNGELLAYMDENVSQKASELGRQQNPSLSGDPDEIIMSYR